MSDGRSSLSRAERVQFAILMTTFLAASLLMAIRLPA